MNAVNPPDILPINPLFFPYLEYPLDYPAAQDPVLGRAIQHLSSLKGVRRWSSKKTLINGFQRLNIISLGDAAIRRVMCRLYGYRTIGKDLFETLKATYSPYESVATINLWKSAFIDSL